MTAQQDAAGLLTLAMTFQGGGTATCRARFGEEAEESVSVTTGGERYVIRARVRAGTRLRMAGPV